MSLFYQSEIVKIFPSGNAVGDVIPNVQTVSTAFAAQRAETMRLGRFSVMPYRQSNQDPLPTMNLEFIPSGNSTFQNLGIMGTGSALDNLATGAARICDFKIQVRETVGGGSAVGTFILKTGVLTNFAFQASIGQTPRANITYEFLDMSLDAVTAVTPPSIDDAYPLMRPQDIAITLPSGIFGVRSVYPQSFGINFPIPRSSIMRIGQRKPVSRELQAPIIATFQIQAIVDTFESTSDINGSTLQMYNLTCGKFLDSDLIVDVKNPICTGVGTQTLIKYTFRKPYLDSINFSNSVGGYTSVDMQFSIPVTFENNLNESNLVIS